jgi:hypothetical protein
MAIWKKEATECKKCGVELTKENKKPKRAICLDCYSIESKENNKKERENRPDYYEIYSDLTVPNRRHIHIQVNNRLKQCVTKEQRKEFFEERFNEIKNDKLLWQYINRNTQRSR